MNTHSAISVARYIIHGSKEQDRYVTPMQLIKLVYLCHGWMLGLHSRPLISDPIEAWQYGPVIPSLYAVVKEFKDNIIVEGLPNVTEPEFDDSEKDLMDQVIEVYKNHSGISLSTLTHKKDTPWDKVWTRYGKYTNGVIPNDLISDHFKALYEQSRDQ